MYSNLLTKALLAASVLVLTSCSNFEFKTNVDPSNFKEYFKPSYASEVSEEDLEKVPNRSLGLVEGVSCQIKDTDAIATETDARTKARVKAADLGANAIKFGKCVRLTNTPACLVSVTCYADALVVDDSKHTKSKQFQYRTYWFHTFTLCREVCCSKTAWSCTRCSLGN